MDYFQKCLSWARVYGEGEYANASAQKHAAFANSVAYLVTGYSGGYGGPSVREHAVSYAIAGSDARFAKVSTNLGELTAITPDGTLPQPGNWTFDQACEFAAPVVFGEITNLHHQAWRNEYCFDDDPEDVKALK